ncbi:M66 family metalloprotease [Lacinutrix sp. Hel_I_90]|uniref:M66 family metalloprotease n=1 Tax=Lacinutrix sp. Hel_I_90 TaxID=1249999 RepID=UPI0005C97067|nr:M66 family metalloprotease [Lacinutrix sp. Hel_I_90]
MHTLYQNKKIKRVHYILLPLFFFLLSCAPDDDLVKINNASSSETGILVDGIKGGVQQNDNSFTASSTLRNIGSFTAPGTNGEIIGFNSERPVAITTPVNWTTNRDEPDLNFNNIIKIPVKVWIVKGNFATQRALAISHCVYTANVWSTERMGVQFSPFEIVDATGDPDASTYYNYTCALQSGIENDIGKDANKINIYYVGTVDGGSSRGQACSIGSDFVAMGENTLSDLLVHELGHDFGLFHTNSNANFNQTGIMHSASSTREFITEGQLFRAHVLSNSAINNIYNARPGAPTRSCGHTASSATCLNIDKRIWADGTFPAN